MAKKTEISVQAQEVTIDQVKSTIAKIISDPRTANKSVAVWGSPGIGKTELFEQAAKTLGMDYRVFLTATMDPTDVNGIPWSEDYFTRFKPPFEFMELTDHPNVVNKGPIIACFDDLPHGQEQVFAALFRLFRNREVGRYKIRPNVFLCGTGNYADDRAGANEIPTALANRFIHFKLKVDVEQWTRWAISNNVHPLVITFVRQNGVKSLWDFNPGNASQLAFPTPRSVATASDLVHVLGMQSLSELQQTLNGTCGEAWSLEFCNFSSIRERMISSEEIFKDPENCKIPGKTNIDGGLATITTLACAVASDPTIDKFIAAGNYAPRLHHKDMGAMLIKDLAIILKENQDLAKTIWTNDDKYLPVIEKWKEYSDLLNGN